MIGDVNPQRRTGLVIAGILALGLVCLWINLDLPVVRNAETYAQAAYSLIDAGLDPRPVIADSTLSCGKPIGFPLLSIPWISWLGGNRGLMVASFLGTALFVAMSWALMARLNEVFGISRESLALQMFLLWFNPLLVYQFWSAYPDTLLAALALAVLLLVDDAAHGRRERLWTSIVTALIVMVATLIKYFGAILVLVLPLAYFCARDPARSRAFRRLWFATALLPVAVFFAAAALGLNPLLEPSGKGGGTEQYLGAVGDVRILLSSTKHSVIGFLFAIVLAFNVLTALLVTSLELRANYRDRRRLFFVLAASVLLLGLLPFGGTAYNVRYFAPVLPFLAVVVARRLLAQRALVRYSLLATFVVIQLALILDFNVRGIHEHWIGVNRALPHQWENLRMGAHLERRAALDLLDRTLPSGAVVYLWSDYYDGCVNTGRERLWRDMGLGQSREIEFRAVPAFTVEGADRRYYVWVDKLRLDGRLTNVSAADLGRVLPGTVTALGHGLFQVDPRAPREGPPAD